MAALSSACIISTPRLYVPIVRPLHAPRPSGSSNLVLRLYLPVTPILLENWSTSAVLRRGKMLLGSLCLEGTLDYVRHLHACSPQCLACRWARFKYCTSFIRGKSITLSMKTICCGESPDDQQKTTLALPSLGAIGAMPRLSVPYRMPAPHPSIWSLSQERYFQLGHCNVLVPLDEPLAVATVCHVR
jgi:hypothetical protein